MRKWIRRIFGIGSPVSPPREMRAGFDSARTTDENAKHWGNVDYLAPVSQMTPEIRRTLRARSRYEVDNNCYASGLVSTLASDVIGTGPRLQVRTGDSEVNRQIESRWQEWSAAVNLADKLRILEESRRRDGEGFAVMASNERAITAVQLDLVMIEADQVSDPWGTNPFNRGYGDDGIQADRFGRPVSYTIQRTHPGDFRNIAESWEWDTVPAEMVFQWFRPRRPGQMRGIPELSQALPLFAQLRRYTLATLTAAETAAMLAGVMKSTVVPAYNADESDSSMTFDRVPLERGTLLTLPPGWEATQFRPEQPTTTYQMFRDSILGEIGRLLEVPFGIMVGDSSRYNYSSAKLDHQGYIFRRDQDREQLNLRVLSPLFCEWLKEARRIPGYLPPLAEDQVSHAWNYDTRGSIDPSKEASADDTRLANGTITRAEIFAARGLDADEQFEIMAREKKRMIELGILPVATADPRVPQQERSQ